VSPKQQRLFPNPRPLVDKLGVGFFRRLPQRPGVYRMQDADGVPLYIGKAKSLRQRLGSYRVANPEQMPRRILRLVYLVESIMWEECSDERAALCREAELLLAFRPRFNRAGVWLPPLKHVAWKPSAQGVELAVTEALPDGWTSLGTFRSRPRALMQALARLAWCRMQPELGLLGMPCGWWRGRNEDKLHVPGDEGVFRQVLAELANEENPVAAASVFDQHALADDIEFLQSNLT
jgi:hypothetical protein